MALSFRGGIALEETKKSALLAIEAIPAPAFAAVPFSRKPGERAAPVVQPEDRVLRGQLIAEPETENSVPVHAPFSGIVKEVCTDGNVGAIVIENDFKNALSESVVPFEKPISKAEPEELCEVIRAAGITDLGKSGVSLARRLQKAQGKARRLIINCVESEPALSANFRLVLEKTQEIVNGAKILLRATGIEKAVFVVEKSRQEAAEALMALCGASPNFKITALKSKYPQSADRQLTEALAGKRLSEGQTPLDRGFFIIGVESVFAVYQAFVYGLPVTERVLTVGGDALERSANLRVPIGASFEDVIRHLGGFVQKPQVVLSGGTMTGIAEESLKAVVGKETGAVIALLQGAEDREDSACIHCGRCVKVCPERLFPLYIARFSDQNQWEKTKTWDAGLCSECGCCTYVCPAGIPLLKKIRLAKENLALPKKGV